MDAALSTNMHYLPDAETRAKTMAAASAFGAPYNVVFWGVDEGATLTSCVERRGILSLGTELGGWGRVTLKASASATRPAQRPEAFGPDRGNPRNPPARRLPGHATHDGARPELLFVRSGEGVFEPRHTIGETVEGNVPGSFTSSRMSIGPRWKCATAEAECFGWPPARVGLGGATSSLS